jgi:hypothetical protein
MPSQVPYVHYVVPYVHYVVPYVHYEVSYLSHPRSASRRAFFSQMHLSALDSTHIRAVDSEMH